MKEAREVPAWKVSGRWPPINRLLHAPIRGVEFEGPGFDVPHDGGVVIAEEGRVAHQQNVHHHASRPHVSAAVVRALPEQLGCDVVNLSQGGGEGCGI